MTNRVPPLTWDLLPGTTTDSSGLSQPDSSASEPTEQTDDERILEYLRPFAERTAEITEENAADVWRGIDHICTLVCPFGPRDGIDCYRERCNLYPLIPAAGATDERPPDMEAL